MSDMDTSAEAVERLLAHIEAMAPGEALTIEAPVAFAGRVRALLAERDALRVAVTRLRKAADWAEANGLDGTAEVNRQNADAVAAVLSGSNGNG